jgi:hypothetical protein
LYWLPQQFSMLHIEKDPALERRFAPIWVNEPGVEEAVDILQGLKHRYEDHHGVTYTDDAGHAHQVWYADENSIRARLRLVQRYGLGGVAVWRRLDAVRPGRRQRPNLIIFVAAAPR